MGAYTLEFITVLPEQDISVETIAGHFAQSDELFSSKFISPESDQCVVGTPEHPRFMEIAIFGEPQKKGMISIRVCLQNPDDLEFQRYHIAHTLRESLSAKHVYLVRDDVSRHYATLLQPKFSLIENELRRFLNRFFLHVVGPEWLRITASPEVYRKMTSRRDRDTENWKELFDNELAFMDFSEIGDLITKQSTGLSNPLDLPQRIQNVRSMEDLQALRHDLESNYSKYFRETFQDRKFHKLWYQLSAIRNKVAHNAPLTGKEVGVVEGAIPKLEKLLRDAEFRIRTVSLSDREIEAVLVQSEAVTEPSPGDYHNLKPKIKVLGRMDLSKVHGHDTKRRKTSETLELKPENDDVFEEFHIEDWELLEALDEQIESGKKDRRRFLALSTFINLLTEEGFSPESVNEMISRLSLQSEIEIYSFDGAHSLKATKAIRRVVGKLSLHC